MPLMRRRQEMGPKLDAGTYEMICTRVREDTIQNPQFGNGDVIRFTLQTTDVVDEDGGPIELEAMANDSLTPNSKLTKWLTAFGVGIPEDADTDLEKVVGRKCLVNVEIVDRGDKGEWNRITELLAPPRSQSARRASREPVGADDEPEPPYHPAAKPGEPVRDLTEESQQMMDGEGLETEPTAPEPQKVTTASDPASDKQRAYIERLLSDVEMEWSDLREIEALRTLPAWPDLTVGSVPLAIEWLLKRKKAGVA